MVTKMSYYKHDESKHRHRHPQTPQYIDCKLLQRLELTWSVETALNVTRPLTRGGGGVQSTHLHARRMSSTDPAVNAENVNTINT